VYLPEILSFLVCFYVEFRPSVQASVVSLCARDEIIWEKSHWAWITVLMAFYPAEVNFNGEVFELFPCFP
jgi:hypothetical protein